MLPAAQPELRAFDVPADVAEKSLRTLSAQSGVDVLFPTRSAGKVRTNAIKGEYTPRDAVDRLLAGTGLVATQDAKTGAFTVSSGKKGQRASLTKASDRPKN